MHVLLFFFSVCVQGSSYYSKHRSSSAGSKHIHVDPPVAEESDKLRAFFTVRPSSVEVAEILQNRTTSCWHWPTSAKIPLETDQT